MPGTQGRADAGTSSLCVGCTTKHMYHEEWLALHTADVAYGVHQSRSDVGQQLCSLGQNNCCARYCTHEVVSVFGIHPAVQLLVNVQSGGDIGGTVVALVQHLAAAGCNGHIWLLAPSQGSAGLLGLARVCNTEMQRLQCTYCEVSATAADQMTLRTAITAAAAAAQAQLSVHSGQLHTTALRRCVRTAPQHQEQAQSTPRAVLLTGGTGGLGLLMADWLVACGHGQLNLLSRSGSIAIAAAEKWGTLSGSTWRVRVELCNVAECNGASQVVKSSCASHMVHSAGVLADALLPNQTQTGLQRVWAPKAHAAWSLHQASCEESMEVDQFVLFSSVAALLGGAGQANYAAANAWLDGLVRLRHEQGLCGSSVQWGAWAGVGMAVDSGVVEQLEAQGMGAVREEQGLCALELTMLPAWGLPVSAMVPLHWPGLVMQMARGVPPLLQNLAADHMDLLQAAAAAHTCSCGSTNEFSHQLTAAADTQ